MSHSATQSAIFLITYSWFFSPYDLLDSEPESGPLTSTPKGNPPASEESPVEGPQVELGTSLTVYSTDL